MIFALLKPGELIESVPYVVEPNTVKSPERSVRVRVVLPFDSNSTEACWIASPLGSVTVPWIGFGGCWADVLTSAIVIHRQTSA